MTESYCEKCRKVCEGVAPTCPTCGNPCTPRVIIVEDADMLKALKEGLRRFDRDNIPMRQTSRREGPGVNVNVPHKAAQKIREIISAAEAQGSFKEDLAFLVLDLWSYVRQLTGGTVADGLTEEEAKRYKLLEARVRKLTWRP